MRFGVDIKFSRLVHDHVPEQNSTAPLRDIAWKVTPAYPIGLPFAFKAWFDKYVWLYLVLFEQFLFLFEKKVFLVLSENFFLTCEDY